MQSLHKTFEVDGSVIYGRADDINRIIDLLSSKDGTDFSSTFVSIVADRGTGRTTLLHILHDGLCSSFDQRKFIYMPEKYDENRLMRVILESLTGTPCYITDLKILEETVKEELMDQRLLLLLDNFENKNQNCWDLLSALLKVCKEKSAIVVTTTRKAVSEVNGPMQFYYMNNLTDGWCLMIFKQCVFNGQNPDSYTTLADIGKCLVTKCRNVTLCIKVLGCLLRTSITEDWWRVILDSNFWKMDEVEGDVLPALRVSYEYLPSHLKQCLKYCSLFPKEYIFSKKHLVHMWSSQGFIEPGEGRDIDNIGLEYFNQLLSLSFFQPSLIPHMREDKFVMPGLIHDLAQQLSKNEHFQLEGCGQRAPESICHLSLVAHEFQSLSLNHIITRPQKLQTFLVFSRSAFEHHLISCTLNLVEVDDIFLKFGNLVTLSLNNCDIEELPETFCSLNNLRYLSLSGTNIKRIPLEISNLIHLQTLEAKDCYYLEELPRTIEALSNLYYLDVTKEVGSVVMPHGIGKLINLRGLATFNVGMDPMLHCGIEELRDMEHLKGNLEISGLKNVRCGMDAKESNMRTKEHIETLFLHWTDGNTFLEGDEGTEIAEEVLESLYPTHNLKEIIIRDYPGTSFPMWIQCAQFFGLISITFDHCYNCERLPDLGVLPSLKFLSIQKMYSVQKMNLSDSEYNPNNSIRYPSLVQLTIWEMYELVEWAEIGNQDFPVLQSLCIKSCPLLMNVPMFPSLVELSVYSCVQFLEAVNLESLQSLRIEGLLKTKSIKLSKDLDGLKKLEISHCPEPLSIEGLSLLNSLETVTVFRCPQLDFRDILDGRHFTFEEKGNTSVWLCQKKVDFSDELDFGVRGPRDEGQHHPIVFNKRKDREYLSSPSGVLADGHKKIGELESQVSKDDQKLTEATMQRLVETVQSSIANFMPAIETTVRSAILDTNSNLIQHSEPSSPVGTLREPEKGSGITQHPSTDGRSETNLEPGGGEALRSHQSWHLAAVMGAVLALVLMTTVISRIFPKDARKYSGVEEDSYRDYETVKQVLYAIQISGHSENFKCKVQKPRVVKNKENVASETSGVGREPLVEKKYLDQLDASSLAVYEILMLQPEGFEAFLIDCDEWDTHSEAKFQVNVVDILECFRKACLSVSILKLYSWRCSEIIRDDWGLSSLLILDPEVCSSGTINMHQTRTVDYLKRMFLSVDSSTYMLFPYHQEGHWIVVVVNLKDLTIHYVDSVERDSVPRLLVKSCLNTALRHYWSIRDKKRASEMFKWIKIPGPKQDDATECGYFAMRSMKIIMTAMMKDGNLPKSIEPVSRPYPDEEIREVVKEVMEFIPQQI